MKQGFLTDAVGKTGKSNVPWRVENRTEDTVALTMGQRGRVLTNADAIEIGLALIEAGTQPSNAAVAAQLEEVVEGIERRAND